jgi:hypothetical protein
VAVAAGDMQGRLPIVIVHAVHEKPSGGHIEQVFQQFGIAVFRCGMKDRSSVLALDGFQ